MSYRVGIMGAGAIGSIVGGFLSKAGHDVTLIDQWPEHVDTMKRDGLYISGTCGEHHTAVKALHLYEAQGITEPFDAAFLAVKGYDTEWATLFIKRLLKEPDGFVVVFQNGLNDPRVAAIMGRERTLGACITIGAALYEPGHVMRTGLQELVFRIGEMDGEETMRVHNLVEMMNDVFPAKVTTNLLGERWGKMALNCMGNPIAGLSGLGGPEMRSDPTARAVSIHIAAEVFNVARAAGYEPQPVGGIAPQRFIDAAAGVGFQELDDELFASAAGQGAGGRPSFLQDVIKGRRVEIEELNGVVVSEGRRLGIATPVNEAVVNEVKRHGLATIIPDPKNLESVAAAIPNR
jgi:2-dehydropantoate 2-reductase